MLVLDGGLGTLLEERIPREDPLCPLGNRLWLGQVLIEKPELIEGIHREYVDAGADVIITATYQILKASLVRDGYDYEEVWEKAIEVAHRAATGKTVALLVGPYATYLADGSEYTGKYPGVDLEGYHRPLVEFADHHSKVDMIAFETIPNGRELATVVELAASLTKRFYILMNMSECGLCDGTTIEQVIEITKPVQNLGNFVGLGLNCCDYKTVAATAAKLPCPVVVYPNWGYEYNQTTGFYGVTKDDNAWKAAVEQWKAIDNVVAIGGCCSTGPHEISLVREIVDRH